MKLPPDQIQKLFKMGAVLGPAVQLSDKPVCIEKASDKKLVEPGISIEPGRVTILIAAETKNETNERSWKAKNRRAGAAWNRTREAIGPHLGSLEPFARHYASGGALKVTFVRIGGRQLDGMANLGAALKGVEDAVAYLLGANDGDPRWHATARQEPGGAVGVRVEIEEYL